MNDFPGQKALPDEKGRFGEFGGIYVPEILARPIAELIEAYDAVQNDPTFQVAFQDLLREYVGRPTPLTPADRHQLG